MMRFLVCSGMERAAAELFRAADTVPGVRPRCCAMVLRVTLGSPRWAGFFLGGSVIYRVLRTSSRNGIFETARRIGNCVAASTPDAPISRDSSATWQLPSKPWMQAPGVKFRPRDGLLLHIYG